ncbi:hypothetical protein FNH22_11340 [Fulvivirga sp. M361]|uniref:hypothetical protein n=1 Tax=Fulvivirga sp. M361 TaxID=2594266 RepID=UPI00117AE641|nr:hypothetical protein [Fulvivirga sp. M361]TRX59110.1 hypothetical protein FNH22_11340 [Fulvivirga sp. M361]
MDNDQYIKALAALLVEKLNWGDVAEWHTKDFDTLSEHILDATAVNLSVTTLKRLLGKVEYNSRPTITTLDAISKYLGYEDWRAFVRSCEIKRPKRSKPELKKRIALPWMITVSLIVVIIFVVFSFISSPKANFKNNPPHFEVERVTKGVPNTVIFRYNVDPNDVSVVEIQQDWDPTKRHRVDPNKNIFTHFYEYPGYYNAKLVLDGHVVAREDLYIPSDGWIAMLSYKEKKPRYLLENEFSFNQKLKVSSSTEQLISQESETVLLNYFNAMDEPQHDFQNFELNTRFKFTVTSSKDICECKRVVLFGTKMSMRIPLTIKGCISNLRLRLGDVFISGKDHDLSYFGVEPGEATDLRILNRNNTLTVYINDQEAIKHHLTNDFGKIAGVRFAFHGAGEVESMELSSEGETLIKL